MNQEIELQYTLRWLDQLQQLVSVRKTKMSQNTIASKIGTNIKAIQRFENNKLQNPKIMFAYKLILLD